MARLKKLMLQINMHIISRFRVDGHIRKYLLVGDVTRYVER